MVKGRLLDLQYAGEQLVAESTVRLALALKNRKFPNPDTLLETRS